MADNFAFEGLCSFVVERHYCSSYAPVVASYTDCLTIPVGHILGRWKVVGVATAGTAEEAADMVLADSGMPLAGTDVDTESAALGTVLADPGIALTTPDIALATPGVALDT